MDSPHKEVLKLLKESGAKQIRSKKHDIWELPDGQRYTLPATPSDHRSWKNNLAKLKWFLGRKVREEKTHADFAHKKKKARAPKHKPHTKFLADLPPREERPPTPISESPLVTLRKKMLDEALQKAIAERALRDGKEIKPYVYGARKARKEESARSGRVQVLEPEITAEAQHILETKGQEAVTAFLNSRKPGHGKSDEELWRDAMEGVKVMDKEGIVEEQNSQQTQTEMADALATALSGGSVEDLLKKHKDLMQKFKWEENKAHIEYLRNAKIVEALEQVAKLVLAPLATAKQMLEEQVGEPLVHVETSDRKLFNWKPTFKEIILTSPKSLNRRQLAKEAASAAGREYGQSYQSMLYFINKGLIVEKEDGSLIWDVTKE